MSKVAFLDDIHKLSQYWITKNPELVSNHIFESKNDFNYCIENEGEIYAYKITENIPLKKLYGFDFFVVRFYFSAISTMSMQKQENLIFELFRHLKQEVDLKKGYYNLRVPAHIVDVLKGINKIFNNTIFCGGTVEQMIYGKEVPVNLKEGMNIFFCDEDYINKYRTELLNMTYKSFENYQGQYHLSYVTQEKAGKIYENWIGQNFNNFVEHSIIIAEYKGEPISFCTIGTTQYAVEGQLSAVSGNSRNLGAYKGMISYLINYAHKNEKCFVSSTQLDNYIVQGTWNSLGLKPYFTFYNFHYDNR